MLNFTKKKNSSNKDIWEYKCNNYNVFLISMQ